MTISICVFCGTKEGNDGAFRDAAYELGRRLAKSLYRLIYGAGHIGLMGEVSQGALDNGGDVLGIVPASLVRREKAGRRPHSVRTTSTLDERKRLMFRDSDAFVALPGGFGTLDELFEAVTLSQIGGHTSTRLPVKEKPSFILNVNGYFNGIIAQMDTMVECGFLSKEHRALVTVVDTVDELMSELQALNPA